MAGELQIWHSDPDILGGTPVFVGTRVPVEQLAVADTCPPDASDRIDPMAS